MRVAISIRGVVQGVGFRPFVHGAAIERGLSGWIRNGTEGVAIEVQGDVDAVIDFVQTLRADLPSPARIDSLVTSELSPRFEAGFTIVESRNDDDVRPTLPPDLAICAACIAEVKSPCERRYRYPFTNCTQCGPRYTVIERLPYDRHNTAMARFDLCRACQLDYEDPTDRRFHAQPIACPACGPSVRLVSPDGATLANGDEALERCGAALQQRRVVALQGLGGFQLLVDATSAQAVLRLRTRKRREEKPFAVMFPSLATLREACLVTPEDEALLCSSAAPIVLVRRRPGSAVADNVAPNNPLLGAMIPCTPLHLIVLERVARPVVCTSGNLSDEPMCTDEADALERLGDIADLFLVHDRPIVRPVDDSVTRIGPTGPQVLRRARGYAPLAYPFQEGPSILALGGQLKSTVTLVKDGQAVCSQHLGDLLAPEGVLLLERTVNDLTSFFHVTPEVVACDLHPDYASTRVAERLAAEWHVAIERVQHHHAHIAACVAEHHLQGPVLGLAWDGSGLGTDGTLWGGEALVVDGPAFQRVAHLRSFALPGGERAIREPRRSALGVAFEAFGASGVTTLGALFADADLSVLRAMLERNVHSPRTTSIGRLFDAVAALAGVAHRAGFEGQAAMELEFAADGVADGVDDRTAYPLPLGQGVPAVADWEPLIRAVLLDVERGRPPAAISAQFHNALVDLAEAIALRAGIPRVALSGGCFVNLRLSRGIYHRLVARGFEVYLPERFPPNDGGLSLGQAYVAGLRTKERAHVSRHPR